MLALYGWVGVVAGLAQAVYLVAAFVLAAHLLGRARRRRDLAPFLLGLNLLFAMGFGYLLCSIGMAVAMFSPDPSPRLVAGLLGPGYAATITGLSAALVFQWRVFWPGARWPLALMGLFFAAMVGGWTGYLLSGGLATGRYEGVWVWLLYGGMLATNLWVGIEPLVYYAKLRKRVPLGLADPLVADRFLLWGLGSLARAVMVVMGPAAVLALELFDADTRITFSAATLMTASTMGLAASLAYWLTFNPTPAYERWVERRYRTRPA